MKLKKIVLMILIINILTYILSPLALGIDREIQLDDSNKQSVIDKEETLRKDEMEVDDKIETVEEESEESEGKIEVDNIEEIQNDEKAVININEESITSKPILPNGTYQIASALNLNKVIDIDGQYTNSGANVNIWRNHNSKNQKFKITYIEDGYYVIEAIHSRKVLDVVWGGSTNGTNVQQYERNNTDSQKWIIKQTEDGYYNIISKCNKLYLDVAGGITQDGTNIQMYEGNGTLAQKFLFKEVASSNAKQTIQNGTYQIVSALNSNKVLDVDGRYTYSGANVHIFQNYNSKNQKFKVTYIGDGCYTIEAAHSEKVLDVLWGGWTNGTNVQQYENNNTDSQKWVIKEAGDGYYYIISKCNDLYLDVAGGSTQDGTNIQMYEGNDTLSQKFIFEKTKLVFEGIDVSEFNGDVNWYLVQQTQDFAMIRVGYRGYLRPRIVMDDKFIQNIQGAQSVGLPCGVYFFSQAINEQEAIEEANWVADIISQYHISYPVVLDSEWSNSSHNGRADYLTKEERTKVSKAFLDTIKNRGYTPMIYASKDWLYNYLDMSQLTTYEVWLAHYTGDINIPSSYTGSYSIWQYTSQGNVNGVNGNVDRNVCYKKY